MSDKLKPCPFCGGTELNTSYINAIYCKPSCGGGVDIGVDSYDPQKEVVEAWNRREPPNCEKDII